MSRVHRALRRLQMDLLLFFTPQAGISLVCICALQTINHLTKPWQGSATAGAVVYAMYGGIEWYEFITPEAAVFWLLQLLPCGMALSGFLDGSMNRRLTLSAYRYGSQVAWWCSKVLACLLGCFALAMLSGALCAGISGLFGLGDLRMTDIGPDGFRMLSFRPVLQALLAYALQMELLMMLGMVVFLVTRRANFSLLAYILPAAWSLMRYSGDDPLIMDNRHRIINWGMAKRFAPPGGFGVDVGEAVAGSLLMILLLALFGALVQLHVNQTQRQARSGG